MARMRVLSSCILGLLAPVLAATPSAAGQDEAAPKTNGPFLVFWCRNPNVLKNATHVTPQVWLKGDDYGQKHYPDFPQDFWLKKNITPLVWKGGCCDSKRSIEALADSWSGAARLGYRGIAIDEFGCDNGGPEDRKLMQALRRARKQAPTLFIAVWQTQGMTDELFNAYAENADLVLIESYQGGERGFEATFEGALKRARKAGILKKTIFALGINDRASAARQKEEGRWANTEAELERQVRWVREHAPDMPGIAFFAPDASDRMVRCADELCGKYYPRDKK